jgi:hypothetical protein
MSQNRAPQFFVVDSNCLRDESLRAFLAASQSNRAVLTDYAAMEAHKGETLTTIFRSMEILSSFPEQVVVLKGTDAVCGLNPRHAGLRRRLIDEEQTAGFVTYCRHLESARKGHARLQEQLLRLGKEANEHMDKLLTQAPGTRDAIEHVNNATYTADQVRTLRTDGASLMRW